MKHVVVYGPAACGKTRNKGGLAKAYGCRNVKEEPDALDLSGRRAHSTKTLFLVTADNRRDARLASANPRLVDMVPFAEAMREAGLRP